MANLKPIYTTIDGYDIKVIVLDKGCVIPPETEAMLQALYSRSHEGVLERLRDIDTKKAKNFMRQFYIGYGHKSIGDCASITVFVEGPSMVAVKSMQDWRLFSGQESSTRYIDFSKQRIAIPRNIDTQQQSKMQAVQEELRAFYLSIIEPTREYLREQFPKTSDEDEATYTRAINSKAFDIVRGFLPIGMTTKTSWHMNMRQFLDELMLLRHHPLEEVRNIAKTTHNLLLKAYPDSFSSKLYEETEEYNDLVMKHEYYFTSKDTISSLSKEHRFNVIDVHLNNKILKRYSKLLKKRPYKTEVPPFLAEAAQFQFEFLIDYGSYRDVQRHRALVQRMPLATTEYGFHPWYIENLPESVRDRALEIIDHVKDEYNKLDVSKEDKQYMLPMGFLVPHRITGDLKGLTYMVELRVSRFVHPTVVEVASEIAQILKKNLDKYGMVLHIDPTPARFDVRRGLQTILLKKR